MRTLRIESLIPPYIYYDGCVMYSRRRAIVRRRKILGTLDPVTYVDMQAKRLTASAQRVQDALQNAGVVLEVHELESSTRTAEEAALSIGCEVGQIAKSLIFRGAESGNPILFILSGTNQLNTESAAAAVGEALCKADADFVRQQTGFAIGGVPPVGHIGKLPAFVDRNLLQYSQIWAAAGTPNAVFTLSPIQLVQLTHGTLFDVK